MKKVAWGRLSLMLFFLLFLTSIAIGGYLFQEQKSQIDWLKTELKSSRSVQSYIQKKFELTKEDISNLDLKFGSLEKSLKDKLEISGSRLHAFSGRLSVQEKAIETVYSKVGEVFSDLALLKNKVFSLGAGHALQAQVDLGNISVEKE